MAIAPLLLALLLAPAGCVESTSPYAGRVLGTATNVTASGLAHMVVVAGTENPNEAVLQSMLVNQGSATLRVLARRCTFIPDDIVSGEGIVPQWPLVDCISLTDTVELAPGGSSTILPLTFFIAPGVRSGAVISVRHALDPELRTEVALDLRR